MKNLLIGLVAVLAIALLFFFTKNNGVAPAPEPVGVAAGCTDEALLCPDGANVGRTGASCTFQACAYRGPYKGKLIQQNTDFRVVIEAPLSVAGEVTYALPIEVTATETLSSLVGKYISVSGKFTEGNKLEVAHVDEVPKDSAGGEHATIKMGETDFANGVRITLNKKIADSRCPTDVQCITAGQATFEVKLQSDTDQEVITLTTNKPAHLFDSFKISIVSVEPAPISTKPIKSEDYLVTFQVSDL